MGSRNDERIVSPVSNPNISSYGSYLQGISSYLPTSIKKQLYTPPTNEEDKDTVLGTSFDEYDFDGERHPCVIISYNNGFQVWDTQHNDGVRQILSIREGPIKSAKFLPTPSDIEPTTAPLSGKRPILAVVSAEETSKFPRSMMKLYSLRMNEYVNTLRFRAPITNVQCNNRVLVVALRDIIYGFDAVTVERTFSLPCYPSTGPTTALALGSRWLAYAANQPIAVSASQSQSHGAQQAKLVDVACDVATDLAKEVASGLYYLGDIGRQRVSNYLYPQEVAAPSAPVVDYRENENAGTLAVYDIVAKKTITHFKAHSHPLSILAFDPTGMLLVTVSIEGHNLNVYQICPPSPSVGLAHTHETSTNYRNIYKLVRGVTNATIQDVCFSLDSKWLAVNSTRGTTHVYAINPAGGPVNIHTHIPNNAQRIPDAHMYRDAAVPGLLTLAVCSRIKHSFFTGAEETNPKTQAQTPIGSTSQFVGTSPRSEQLFVMTQSGTLVLYQLQPHAPLQQDVDPMALQLTTHEVSVWDLCRRSRWPEAKHSLTPGLPTYPVLDSEQQWLTNVEISSHSPNIRPLWILPQFVFKTYNSSTAIGHSPTHAHSPNTQFTRAPGTSARQSSSSTNGRELVDLSGDSPEITTKKLDIRRFEPMPFKEGLEDHGPMAEKGSGARNNRTSGSATSSDDHVKENMLRAMTTQMIDSNPRTAAPVPHRPPQPPGASMGPTALAPVSLNPHREAPILSAGRGLFDDHPREPLPMPKSGPRGIFGQEHTSEKLSDPPFPLTMNRGIFGQDQSNEKRQDMSSPRGNFGSDHLSDRPRESLPTMTRGIFGGPEPSWFPKNDMPATPVERGFPQSGENGRDAPVLSRGIFGAEPVVEKKLAVTSPPLQHKNDEEYDDDFEDDSDS